MNGQSDGGKARAKNLSPERRSEIAKAAAAQRWKKNAEPTTRITVTVRESDLPLIERLRKLFNMSSAAAVVRKLIRDAAKEKLK